MSAFLNQLSDWIALHPLWAGAVVFLVALIESLAIIGFIVPGVIILFGAGALIGSGALEFWSTCLWAFAGAVLGDNLSFWLGHHYEERLSNSRWFRLHPAQLQKGIDFIHKHGGMSIAIGRFFGPLRAVVPLAAGLLRMQPSHFLIANVLSALFWAPAYLIPGMVFGASLEQAGPVSVRLALILLILAACFFGLFKLMRPWLANMPLRYIISGILLMAVLAGLHLAISRDISALHEPQPTAPPTAVQLRQQGWLPMQPRRPLDLLKLLSSGVAMNERPPLFHFSGRNAWVRTTGPDSREILIVGPEGVWQLEERTRDYLLLWLPLTRHSRNP